MQKDIIIKVFKKLPVLETPNLILRKMKTSDYKDMYEYACQEKVTRYLLWRPHPNKEYTYNYLDYLQSQYRMGEFYDWAVILKSENKMIGTCGFAALDTENNSAEIGYVLNPAYWGRGIATEAVKRVLCFGFIELNLNRIEARYIKGNEASRKVMEKCGMTYEGLHRSSLYVKEEYVSVGYCGMLSEDFMRSEG